MKARRFDFYFDDWLTGTMGLNLAERGMYITAIAAMGSHGGPIPETELRRLCPCDLRIYKRALEALTSSGKLRLSRGYLSNKRGISEVEKARKRLLSAVQKGRKGGRPIKQINDIEKPQPKRRAKAEAKLPSPSPSPSPEEEERTDASASGEARARRAPTPPMEPGNGRKTRIPADWQPDLIDYQHAAARGHDAAWVAEEAPGFRDHHVEKATLSADWRASWRTWVRRAEVFAERDTNRGGSTNRRPATRSGPITDAINAIRARRELG